MDPPNSLIIILLVPYISLQLFYEPQVQNTTILRHWEERSGIATVQKWETKAEVCETLPRQLVSEKKKSENDGKPPWMG